MKFKCNCGSTALNVIHFYDIVAPTFGERWSEWGLLDDDHHWEYDDSEKVEDFTVKDPNYDSDDDSLELDPDSEEFYVHCAECDKEIEFGWSHPDRGGRIWPVECDDFNPRLCWLEPRYLSPRPGRPGR